MNAGQYVRTRPIPMAATAVFLVTLLVTVAYFAGLVPGVPKTLSTFGKLLAATAATFVFAAAVWIGSALG